MTPICKWVEIDDVSQLKSPLFWHTLLRLARTNEAIRWPKKEDCQSNAKYGIQIQGDCRIIRNNCSRGMESLQFRLLLVACALLILSGVIAYFLIPKPLVVYGSFTPRDELIVTGER